MMNSKLTEEQRTKWLAIVKSELISSEESDEDDAIVVHPLPWRSEYVDTMFQKLTNTASAINHKGRGRLNNGLQAVLLVAQHQPVWSQSGLSKK